VAAAWPEPVERVSSFLREAGAEARIEQFTEGTPTADDAAAAVGCGLDQIVKSLVFVCDGKPVVALVPGDRRGDREKVAGEAEATTARIASAEEVERATGFSPGAVAPFPLPEVDVVLLDRGLLRHRIVWAGAGSHQHIVGLSPAELARLSRARVANVSQEPPSDTATEGYDSTKSKER
jgi:prolyl-tRNA editing enzyme YbaK/EbsC (Cys-tRNA(Pro) deacylase)